MRATGGWTPAPASSSLPPSSDTHVVTSRARVSCGDQSVGDMIIDQRQRRPPPGKQEDVTPVRLKSVSESFSRTPSFAQPATQAYGHYLQV